MAALLPHPPLELGECPRWDAAANRLLLVDILGGRILHGTPEGLAEVGVDGHVGCVAPVRGRPSVLLAGIDDGVAVVELATGALTWLARPEAPRAGEVRMNDGACDPQGRFVVGSMRHDKEEGAGRLHRVAADGRSEVLLDGCTIPNGLVWSGDGATLFHVDSGPKTITAYPYDEARLGVGRVVYRHEGEGAPDGMCAGPEGTLWVAIHNGGVVRRLSPEGEVVEEVAVEARQPTACWALPDGRLVVTSGMEDLEDPGPADGRTALLDAGALGAGAQPFG